MSDAWDQLRAWLDDELEHLRRSIGQRLRYMREAREKAVAIGGERAIDAGYRARALDGAP